MRRGVAIDTNLLVLLIVGRVQPTFIQAHKRLQEYSEADYDLLINHVGDADIHVTPNAMTETSNLVGQGVREPLRSALLESLFLFSRTAEETYVRSSSAMADLAYVRLGLTDVAWLSVFDGEIELITADLGLHNHAVSRGLTSTNFNHLRDPLL